MNIIIIYIFQIYLTQGKICLIKLLTCYVFLKYVHKACKKVALGNICFNYLLDTVTACMPKNKPIEV